MPLRNFALQNFTSDIMHTPQLLASTTQLHFSMNANHFHAPATFLLRPYVQNALSEDIRSGDITTQALVPTEISGNAHLNARESGVVCGVELVRLAFTILDENAQLDIEKTDGESIERGETILRVRANGQAILTGERVALNFLQRLCGIATLTQKFVRETQGTKARIVDTRKTTPGLRLLEKYAVRCGGGTNHRFALDDLILIKDNHIALCGGIAPAIERARANVGHAVKIEVECDTLEQVEIAAQQHADIILLDNMSAETLRSAVEMAKQIAPNVLCEASGGINLETVRAAAQAGVDLISIGALTHSARSLDIGLDIELR